jgi:hypothetical protein
MRTGRTAPALAATAGVLAWAALLACAPSVRPWSTEIVVPAAAPVAVASGGAPPPPPPAAPSTCTRSVHLDTLDPETPTCNIHGLAAGDEGTLVLPCKGDGEAVARFSKYELRGVVSRGVLELVHDRTEEFKDGCKWRFLQHLRGEAAEGELEYEYEEEIVLVRGSCYSPCGGTGAVSVR